MFTHKRQQVYITGSVLLAALIVVASATASTPSPEFRDSFRSDGTGCILCTDKKAGTGNLMGKRDRELLEAIGAYVPGRNSAEIKELFGKPRAVETKVPIKEWPEKVSKAKEVWLYCIGEGGWGYNIALCFTDDRCADAIVLDFTQQNAYEKWKTDLIEAYSQGKPAADILRQFGEPYSRNGPKQFGSRKPGQEAIHTSPGDETWSYPALDSEGVWVYLKDGKCVAVQHFGIFH
jgi:hypothetical protein